MESFIKRVMTNNAGPEIKRYFMRFGKGNYKRRFLMSIERGKMKIKVRTSFELANDIVKFVEEISKETKFSGKILMKDKVLGKEGRKKAGVFVYEINECKIEDYLDAYYYLLDSESAEISLKIKKALPKPGKNEEKIDDKFCALDLDLRYWNQVKEKFFWDVPECKKAIVEHEIVVKEVELPKGEKDPVKIRENAVRKGKIKRKIAADGKEIIKEYDLRI